VPGDTTATGQVLRSDASARAVLDEAVRRTDFRRKREQLHGTNRGIGLALFYHGAGFTGAGEERLKSRARLDLTPTGAAILVASTEIGQGTRTMHAQIVADALGVPYETIEVAQPDTAVVADSGPTVASRTCMVVGKILERCALEMKAKLGGLTPAEYFAKHGPLSVVMEHVPPPWIHWNDDTYQGDAYPTYSWGCDVVEIELDRDTYEARPRHVTVVQEFGRPIHPALAQGQIEGGTVQGLGYALLERVVMRDGVMGNPTLTNYTIPTTLDIPELDVVMLENHFEDGPFGAKGLGELPMDGPAPAVVNAIRHLGLDLREIPATPETLLACNSL
jgi:CO/xanthine dehydrogenase Mo-binding subunit